MRTRRTFVLSAAILTVGTGTFILGGAAYVKISGTVHSPEGNLSPLLITVENSYCDTVWSMRSKARTFRFQLAENEIYVARFEQAGCLAKEVVVDARNATRPWDRKPKNIRFEVILEYADTSMYMRYADPVGRIHFNKKNRLMRVEHDYAMEVMSPDTSSQVDQEEMLP